MIGLSHGNSNDVYWDIDYSMYVARSPRRLHKYLAFNSLLFGRSAGVLSWKTALVPNGPTGLVGHRGKIEQARSAL